MKANPYDDMTLGEWMERNLDAECALCGLRADDHLGTDAVECEFEPQDPREDY